MINYVLGFAYDKDKVLLIRKKRPSWQAGKWNGIGGKIKRFETLHQAMNREYLEETGLKSSWHYKSIIIGEDFTCNVLYARMEGDFKQKTDEIIGLYNLNCLPEPMLNNTEILIKYGLIKDNSFLKLNYYK